MSASIGVTSLLCHLLMTLVYLSGFMAETLEEVGDRPKGEERTSEKTRVGDEIL
jgi:hypothetical protein